MLASGKEGLRKGSRHSTLGNISKKRIIDIFSRGGLTLYIGGYRMADRQDREEKIWQKLGREKAKSRFF